MSTLVGEDPQTGGEETGEEAVGRPEGDLGRSANVEVRQDRWDEERVGDGGSLVQSSDHQEVVGPVKGETTVSSTSSSPTCTCKAYTQASDLIADRLKQCELNIA